MIPPLAGESGILRIGRSVFIAVTNLSDRQSARCVAGWYYFFCPTGR